MAYFNRFNGCHGLEIPSYIPLIFVLIVLLTMKIHYLRPWGGGSAGAVNHTVKPSAAWLVSCSYPHDWSNHHPRIRNAFPTSSDQQKPLGFFHLSLKQMALCISPRSSGYFHLQIPTPAGTQEAGNVWHLSWWLHVTQKSFSNIVLRGLILLQGYKSSLQFVIQENLVGFFSPLQIQTVQYNNWPPVITGIGPKGQHSLIQAFIPHHTPLFCF